MTSIVVGKRSISGWQDKRARVSPGGVSCNTLIFASLCQWTNMSNSKLRPIEVPRGYLSNTKEISDGMLTNVKGVNGGLGWLASTARPDCGYDRRSTQLISRGQRGSETMSRSSHHHHDLAHSICGATLDNIHGLKFRHWRETTAPTGLVGVCYKQIFQPRTVGAGECTALAKSKAHTKSQKSTVGRNLCSKLSSGGR